MEKIKRKIQNLKKIRLFSYIYLNHFCSRIERNGKGRIIPYKNAVIDLEKGSQIRIEDENICIGVNKLKKSKTETYVRLRENAVWDAKKGCEISYGSTIEILKNAELESKYFTMNNFGTLVSAKKIILGEDVMIARNAVVFDSDFHVIEYDENQAEYSETVSIGDHVWIGANAIILKGVIVGNGSIIAANTVVTKNVEQGVMVGNPVMTKVEQCRARGVKIGDNVDLINAEIDYCFGHLITIGNNVTITNSVVLAHDASTKKELGYSKIGCVDIGDNVFIGYGSIILPNVRIGNKVIVGAGTVVSKDIPDNVVVVGPNAKIIGTYDDYMDKNRNRMKECPVSNVLFCDKTEAEWDTLYKEVKVKKGGFDL